ncbi:MAG TPA: translational GTPase TypA [Verrucomicrobiales bacterium]|nr:translational GTPase TypA [Verrucomicrobiales bacterium]HIL71288.1 translational GTPase TypA [Verrucomicrobiota bacterium]
MEKIRNIAIIAHIDHGKTTLVDCLLNQSGTFRSNQHVEERMMDSMDLEREKGITIKAKNAAFKYKDFHINIIDTPGHADFGGEVERTMNMIDGVLLLVDAVEGPQAQTRFVLKKALESGARPMVIINKIDRDSAEPHRVLDEVFELFISLNATDEQLDFAVIYASAKSGMAMLDLDHPNDDMQPLFEAIVKQIPPPKIEDTPDFRLLVSNLDYSDYLGRIAFGKILSGKVKTGETIVCLHGDGSKSSSKISALFNFEGMKRIQIKEASAGDIIGICGFNDISIGETIASNDEVTSVPFVPLDPPTIRMEIAVNDGPFAGMDGSLITARQIRERLERETRTNISLKVNPTDAPNIFEVQGRGEMQIAVIVEEMRREGFELLVSKPKVIYRKSEDGKLQEPFEKVYIQVPNEYLGDVLKVLAGRRCDISDMEHQGDEVSLEGIIPTRGLIGIEGDLINLTRGHSNATHIFQHYGPFCGEIKHRRNGALVSLEQGETTAYALNMIQGRGKLLVRAGEKVYQGMIIGENAREDDLTVNPCKPKKLTNMRSQGDGKGIMLEPPIVMTLEKSLEYISDDEYLEATPNRLRLRKRILDETMRKRASYKKAGIQALITA